MIGKFIDLTSTEALFLMALHSSSPLSGSEIVQKIKDDLGEEWVPSPGAVYKLVQSLETKGFIEETTDEENRDDKRIRSYKITKDGIEMVGIVGNRFRKLVVFATECCPDTCKGIVIVDKRKKGSDDCC